jgi:hypothetical protein
MNSPINSYHFCLTIVFNLKKLFCNTTKNLEACPDQSLGFCECTHILELKLNELVELFVIDGGYFSEPHSAHIHGYKMALIGQEKVINARNYKQSNVILMTYPLSGPNYTNTKYFLCLQFNGWPIMFGRKFERLYLRQFSTRSAQIFTKYIIVFKR